MAPLVVFAALFMAVQSWSGCSVEEHYDLLSTFFDGVPDPNAMLAKGGFRRKPGVRYITHKPYADQACTECHVDPSNALEAAADSSFCMNCHEGIPTEYTWMHGPVAGLACLWCHTPHLSEFEHLLRVDGPELCVGCHDPEQSEMPLAEGCKDVEHECLDCHAGHGGPREYFLRETVDVETPGADTEQGTAKDGT
jgi:predicted CXXCH cytochrome family protein